jgi:putative ABC transport system substrate-binding protein
MKRRDFITLLGSGAAAWPLAVRAQQDARIRRIGLLSFGREEEFGQLRAALREELRKLGWIEGRNLLIDFRFGAADVDRTRAYAAELVQLAPEVIVTLYRAATYAVQRETKTIPIVFAGIGEIADDVVKNPSHPEENTTGYTNLFASIGSKWLELLKEAVPSITHVAVLANPDADSGRFPLSIEAAAPALHVQASRISVRDTASMKSAIAAFAAEPNGGLIPSPPAAAIAPREFIGLAAQYRLPVIYQNRGFAAIGGLMSYGSAATEFVRGAATYVDRILRGAKVNELPVQFPTKFYLTINLKTAKALGLTVPPALVARADEVIE